MRHPVPLWDQALVEAWQREQRAISEARTNQWRDEQERKQREWWAWYDAYLQTEKWQRKRRAVLERDSYQCQACLSTKATQVHHLNYKHVGDEPLFDLISVCERCHTKLHQQEVKP